MRKAKAKPAQTSVSTRLHHDARGRQGFSGTKTRKCDSQIKADSGARSSAHTGVLPSPLTPSGDIPSGLLLRLSF